MLLTFWVLNTLVPQLCTRHGGAPASRAEAAVKQQEGKPLSRPGRAGWRNSGKEKRIWAETVDRPGRKRCHPPARPLRHPSSTA